MSSIEPHTAAGEHLITKFEYCNYAVVDLLVMTVERETTKDDTARIFLFFVQGLSEPHGRGGLVNRNTGK